jgi:hypothetical protein
MSGGFWLGEGAPSVTILFVMYSTQCYSRTVAEPGRIRIFQTKVFARLARAEGVDTDWLIRCVTEAEDGLIEANLGRGLIKQRLARPGQGKSGSLRTIVVFHKGNRAIFIDIFAKKDKANFTDDELKAYRKLAGVLLNWSDKQISEALAVGGLIEISRRDGVEDGKKAPQRSARRSS